MGEIRKASEEMVSGDFRFSLTDQRQRDDALRETQDNVGLFVFPGEKVEAATVAVVRATGHPEEQDRPLVAVGGFDEWAHALFRRFAPPCGAGHVDLTLWQSQVLSYRIMRDAVRCSSALGDPVQMWTVTAAATLAVDDTEMAELARQAASLDASEMAALQALTKAP